MADSNTNSFNNNNDDDDLTSIQEYVIAGGVILLFGLLYWFINHGWNDANLSVASSPLPKSEFSALNDSKRNTDANVGLQATALGTAAVVSSSSKAAPTPETSVQATTVKATPVQVKPATPIVEEKVNTPNFQVKATPKTPDKLAAVAQLESAEQALKATEAETKKASEEAKIQAEAVRKPADTDTDNKIEKKQQAVASKGSVYTLPDGTEVTIAPDGFEDEFKQLIEKGEINKPITFDNIHFDTGSIKINAKSEHQVKATAALLHKHPNINILLRGHTDNTGFRNTNIQLSLSRANSMGVALGRLGIDTRRIQVTAMGASDPVASNDTEEGRKKNRRIEVLIIE